MAAADLNKLVYATLSFGKLFKDNGATFHFVPNLELRTEKNEFCHVTG
jgi:hypothetical protein